MIIEYIVLIEERWWFTGNIYVLPQIRYDILIEIFQCIQLVPIDSLCTTCVCFEPKPAWKGGFPALMTSPLLPGRLVTAPADHGGLHDAPPGLR